MKNIFYATLLFAMPVMAQQTSISTLEDTNVDFNEQNYWNGGKIGTPEEGDWGEEIYHCSWTSGVVTGHIDYNFMPDEGYGSYDWWGGLALSQRTGTELGGMDDQYNNIVGKGANDSKTFAVIYGDLYSIDINVEGGAKVKSMYVVNSAYTMQNVLVGDGYSAKFQNDGDHIYLDVTSTKADGTTAKQTIKLAEFTTELSYIKEWTKVDLSQLGDDVVKLTFTFDVHNTGVPLYACIDDIEIETANSTTAPAVATFEDLEIGDEHHMSVSTEDDDERTEFVSGGYEFATGCMHDWSYWFFFGYANETDNTYKDLEDQWKNVVGGGYNGSANYGVGYVAAFNGPAFVTVLADEGAVVPGFYITNSAYTYSSLTNGDGYAKKFDLGDWYKLTITGYDAEKNITGTKDYYLADLRDAATAYIIDDWRYVDLSMLGKVKQLKIEASSSDGEGFDIKTPTYFCFDDFGATGEEILPEKNTEVSTAITAHNANATATARGSYDISGRQTNGLNKGVNIIRMSDGSVRKVVIK